MQGTGRQPSGQAKTVISAALAEKIASGAHRPAVQPKERALRQRGLVLARLFRRAFSLAAGAYILSLLFIFVTPLLKADRLAGMAFVQWIHRAVDPLLRFVMELVSFDFTAGRFNFLPAGLAVAVYILQQIISGRLHSLEGWIEKPLLEATKAGSLHAVAGALQAAGHSGAMDASRMSLLRQYAAAKKVLGEARRQMAFLSIDVAGSTRMKAGEDKLVIEHAFSEYKKFLERIFREFRVYKVAWTPDGVMTAFPSPDDAAGAARKVLKELEWFNRDVHQMKTKFEVRCGLSYGEVMIPDEKPLEEVSDQIIDVAGHLQKYAERNELWISGEVYTRLADTSGYVQLDRQVDNHEVYAFRRPS
jgi:class 3 adenylate cyclase